MAEHGRFGWNELMTNDVEAARTFYSAVIGWSFDGMDMGEDGTYWIAMADGQPAGGIMDMTGLVPPDVPPHWFSYLEVDDVNARVKILTDSGGEVLREPFDIPGVGRIAIIKDSTGAALGLMTSSKG